MEVLIVSRQLGHGKTCTAGVRLKLVDMLCDLGSETG
jgi:hypothetical protein